MWVSPLSTFDEIWNCSTWLICAGSRVTISPTPAQPAFSSPPACAAARRTPTPGIRCHAESVPAAASRRSVVRRSSRGPHKAVRLKPNSGSRGSKS